MALDIIWKEVTDLRPLLSLLVPLEKAPSGDVTWHKFIRPLEYSDWDRFERYRYRVHKLSYSPSETEGRSFIHDSVFDDIMWRRPGDKIVLPRMHTLEWFGPMKLCALFMHNGVRNLTLCFPRDGLDVSRAIGDIIALMPELSILDLRYFTALPSEAEINRLLSGLPNLKRITLPAPFLTNTITETASQLGCLDRLAFWYGHGFDQPSQANISGFTPVLSNSSFPVLTKLITRVPYQKVLKVLAHSSPPSNLTLLFLQSRVVEHPSVLFDLTTAIARACPLIEKLQFDYLTPTGVAIENNLPAPDQGHRISFHTLSPLLKCTNLSVFTISHKYPLDLRLGDMERIATSWPAIRHLVFNHQPSHLGHTDLTLDALVPLARRCPKLGYLGIFLDADPTPSKPSPQSQPPSFKSLKTLCLGVSPIQHESHVLVFLGRICRQNIVIKCTDNNLIGNDQGLQLRLEKWKKVNELLPSMIDVRMEERNRSQHLMAEQEEKFKAAERDLQAEVQRLQNKVNEFSKP
ncbi:hypothetical protein H0H92_004626 [Tricholoma furcatifolium]|nr:hypothetical protein H0H92_004626 [Tricholoma furcatifolium]